MRRIANGIAWCAASSVGLGLLLSACGSSSSSVEGAPPAACADIRFDRFKEIEVVDEAVVADRRSSNALRGPWSFRALFEELTPPGTNASDFVQSWLSSWDTPQKVNLFSVPQRPLLRGELSCPWLKLSPENECNDDCSTCTSRTYDLAKAPFRLIAIANRIDVRTPLDAGETRFVFAMTGGPGDDPASRPREMSVAFEYGLPRAARTPKAWEEAWHRLGSYAQFDESYRAELQAFTDLFTKAGQDSTKPHGVPLNQLRTNERVFDWQWQLREYHLTDSGLRLSATDKTPDVSLNGSDTLARFVLANASAIDANTHELPANIAGGQAEAQVQWRLPGVPEDLRHAFARETCNGCHQSEATSLDINFHISPFKQGLAKLSPFLNNPADPEHDELGRREVLLRSLLCE